ncbi:MAG: hypothetical protein JJ900_03730 [Rhodospirillales bacterium]|nr:hypothetical protein [Rhodospirillales bacterium]MBO6785936.1 hypothetical protein [Rhodospirillales bacterium]
MRFTFPASGIAVLSAFLCFSALEAQTVNLNAVSYAELPSGRDITVETFDDSEKVKKLKALFEEELELAGYNVTQGARMILSFEARDTEGSWSGGGPNRLIEIRESDNHTGKDAPDVRVNIFDSQRGGLLNPKRDKGITQVAPSQFRIDASIEDRTNGKRLWQGWSVTEDFAVGESHTVQRSMVKPIIESIGKTVRDE